MEVLTAVAVIAFAAVLVWLFDRGSYPRKIDEHTQEVAPGRYVHSAPLIASTEAPAGYMAVAWRNGYPYKFRKLSEDGTEWADKRVRLMPITHVHPPLSFSDQCGYTLVCLDSGKTGGIDLTLDIQVTEHIGWWQDGWIASLFRSPTSTRRSFVGCYVWREGSARVPFNLEDALIELQRKIEGTG